MRDWPEIEWPAHLIPVPLANRGACHLNSVPGCWSPAGQGQELEPAASALGLGAWSLGVIFRQFGEARTLKRFDVPIRGEQPDSRSGPRLKAATSNPARNGEAEVFGHGRIVRIW